VQSKQPRYDAGNARGGNDWPAIAIQIAVATIFSGVIAYVATNPEQLVQAQSAVGKVEAPTPVRSARPAPPEAPAAPDEPVQVRVTNPFDKTEVFNFPAGTSETDAQLAVARLLMQRAQERQPLWARSDHRLKKRANHLQPGTDLTSTGVGSTPAMASAGPPQS
jgi:hypothetical protein